MRRAGALALLLIAGCSPTPAPAPGPANNSAEAAVPEATPAPARLGDGPQARPSADAPLAEWLVGHWAYEDDCATDFTVIYSADGKLDAHGEVGSWAIKGSEVTETITAHMGEAGTEPVDPPQVIRYTVEKQGADRGVLRRGNASQPIRRC